MIGYGMGTAQISTGLTASRLGAFTADGEPRSLADGRGDLLLLSRNPRGFFLVVEGSQIDWCSQESNAGYVVNELLDFDGVFGAALDFAERDVNTLVIVTADHETGRLALTNGDAATGRIEGTFANGPGAGAFIGIYENTAIFDRMMAALVLPIYSPA